MRTVELQNATKIAPSTGSVLVVSVFGDSGQIAQFSFGMSLIRVGRDPGSDLQLKHKCVSRYHATIMLSGRDIVVYDNDSANGTFVAGKLIREHTLSDGEEIQIGPYRLGVLIKGVTKSEAARIRTVRQESNTVTEAIEESVAAGVYAPDAPPKTKTIELAPNGQVTTDPGRTNS